MEQNITLVKKDRTVVVKAGERKRLAFMLRNGWRRKVERRSVKADPVKTKVEPVPTDPFIQELVDLKASVDGEKWEMITTALRQGMKDLDEFLRNGPFTGPDLEEEDEPAGDGTEVCDGEPSADEGAEVKGNVPNPTEAESVKTDLGSEEKAVTPEKETKPTKPKAKGS